MAYRFESDNASVQDGVRRIAIEEIDKVIAALDDGALGITATAHKVRKSCKKLRGLARLVRPGFEDYRTENAAFRDAAKMLSALRDSEALIETHDALIGAFGDQIDRPRFASVRRRLASRQREIARSHEIAGTLITFRNTMDKARNRVDSWRLADDGFDAIAGGLHKTYKRARKAEAGIQRHATSKAIHEWRKRAKYHWYHARLLTPVWPAAMKAHCKAVKRLGQALGMHHDLAVLRRTVRAEPEVFGPTRDIDVLSALIAQRQRTIAAHAFALAARPLAERPSRLAHRWQAYWQAWRAEERCGGAARGPHDTSVPAALECLDRG